VKKARRFCEQCNIERAKPSNQLMGDLPKERLAAFSPPFTHTAVDYFGPIETAYGRGKTAKRYGVIFTCLTTRATYLDVAKSLSSEDFLLVLRRFFATFSTPKTMHSDNGTNFVGAEKDLLKEVKSIEKEKPVTDYLENAGVTWKFQPPNAPHFGGAHESLIRTVKTALYRTLKEEEKGLRHPTDEVLQTLMFEVSSLLT